MQNGIALLPLHVQLAGRWFVAPDNAPKSRIEAYCWTFPAAAAFRNVCVACRRRSSTLTDAGQWRGRWADSGQRRREAEPRTVSVLEKMLERSMKATRTEETMASVNSVRARSVPAPMPVASRLERMRPTELEMV